MADKKNHDEHLERIITNHLAESMLGLSDESIIAETSEAGADPEQEAEATRLVLRQASRALDNVTKRLSNLGHIVNSNWARRQWGYHNRCLNCGSSVSFATATGEMQGEALDGPCPESGGYAIRRQEASRK